MMDGFFKSIMSGRICFKSSIFCFNSLYACQAFKSDGNRTHWSPYLIASSSTFTKSSLVVSLQGFSLKLFIDLITVSYKLYSLFKFWISLSVFSSSGYAYFCNPNNSSPLLLIWKNLCFTWYSSSNLLNLSMASCGAIPFTIGPSLSYSFLKFCTSTTNYFTCYFKLFKCDFCYSYISLRLLSACTIN